MYNQIIKTGDTPIRPISSEKEKRMTMFYKAVCVYLLGGLVSKEEIVEYFETAIKKEPRQLISALIKEIVLYNDKIEIYYNYTDSKKPDGDDRRTFVFYECEKSFEIERTKFGAEPLKLTYHIFLMI